VRQSPTAIFFIKELKKFVIYTKTERKLKKDLRQPKKESKEERL
jgi:hypothetical protein